MYMDMMFMINLCLMSLLMIILAHKFMLVILMVMEVLVLNISFLMYQIFSAVNLEVFMLYYIIFSVCESVLGLMILVLIIRFEGNDYYLLSNLYKF